MDSELGSKPIEPTRAPTLEIAHVLFMDIVGYSKLPMDHQRECLYKLQQTVSVTPEFEKARFDDRLLRLPTGDGMALVFFTDPEAPARCALELSRALRQHPEIKLRMGIHTGPVYHVEDTNANRNVAGGGINLAQRVMDCGDAGHILVSKAVADVLNELTAWNGLLGDLGEAEVKHGVRLQIFNLHAADAGNPNCPHKLHEASVRRTAAWSAVGVGTITLGCLVIIAWYFLSGHGRIVTGLEPQPVKMRPSVAVMGFRNVSKRSDKDWLSESLTEALNSELSEGGQLRLVSGESVARMKIDLSLPDSDSYAAGTLRQIRQNIAADYVIQGSFFDSGDQTNAQIRVDARLQDARSGETVDSVIETGSESDLNGLLVKTGADLRQRLNVVGPSPEQQTQSRAALPSNLEAARYYAEGLQKLRAFDSLGARDSLAMAVQNEPTFALAHSALAAAWANLGYDAKARDSAKKAAELSTNLDEENRQWIEAQVHETNHEQGKAVAIYQALFRAHPDNLEYGLRLLGAMIRGGQFKDTKPIADALRQLSPPAGNDPRIDLLSANAAFASGDYPQSVILAKAAETKAESTGGRLTVALALMRRGAALNYLGQKKEAVELDEKALHIFAEAGDRDDVGKMNANLGAVLNGQGNYAEGIKRQRESLEEFRRIGDKRGEAIVLSQLGWDAQAQDRLDEAQGWYERALAIDRELDDESLIATVTRNLAEISQFKGDLSGATRKNEQVLAIARESGNLDMETGALSNLVELYSVRGDLATAKEMMAQVDAILAKTGSKRDAALASAHWGSILAAENNLRGARQKYEESLRILALSDEKTLLPFVQMYLAEVEIEQGQTTESEALLTQVINYFHSQRNSADEGWAMGIYARAELESGDIAAAKKKATEAVALCANDQTLSSLGVRLLAARVEGLSGDRKTAETELKMLLKVAERQGNVPLAFDARFALGEMALKWKDPEGNRILSSLSEDAASKGFLQVSRKADSLLRNHRPALG